MKAVLLRRSEKAFRAVLEEVPVPEIGPGEMLVEMKACGLCGTDLEKIKGEYTASAPVVGHEAVGLASVVGEGVLGFSKGDRVFPHHHVPCGECYYCTHGDLAMCDDYRKSNLYPCGFSEFIRVPEWNVARGGVLHVPGDLDLETASFIEPVACCIRALDRCEVGSGDSVLVSGAGPVGMSHAILLSDLGAEVTVSDVVDGRLDFVRSSGLATAADARSPGFAEEIRRRTAGRGVDVGIVASGSVRAVAQTLRAVRKGGKLCLFGIPAKGSTLDYDVSDVYNADISIIPSYGATEAETARAVKAVAKQKDRFASLITHRFPLAEFDAAVKTASAGSAMKVVVMP